MSNRYPTTTEMGTVGRTGDAGNLRHRIGHSPPHIPFTAVVGGDGVFARGTHSVEHEAIDQDPRFPDDPRPQSSM